MTGSRQLRIDVGDLLDRPNTRRPVHQHITLGDDLAVAGSRLVPEVEVELDLVLESMPSGVAVNGTAQFTWVGECRRCLEEVRDEIRPEVHEIFEVQPTPDETFPIEGAQVDLEPIVREAVFLALPLAPLCRDDCRGPAPESFPAQTPGDRDMSEVESSPDAAVGDPRWAALDDLEFD